MTFINGKQKRVAMAAYNKREVADKIGVSLYYVTYWWCETANPIELERALANPRIIVEGYR